MSDPRLTDPKWNDPVDPRLNDPVLRRDTNGDGAWGWIAGVAVLLYGQPNGNDQKLC